MPRNDDGEFELILGNKQLLSVFFLVVVLLGVFFTLGYVVGRSSAPVGQVETAKGGRVPDAAAPIVIDPSQAKPSPSSAAASTSSVKPVSPAGQNAEPPPVVAARDPEPVERPAPPVVRSEAVKPVTKAAARTPDPTPIAPAPSAGSNDGAHDPPAGSYLQVVSVMRVQAETLVDTLRKQRGLPATLAPGPADSKLLRVVVGPFRDPADVAKAKADLEAIGFHPFPKKY